MGWNAINKEKEDNPVEKSDSTIEKWIIILGIVAIGVLISCQQGWICPEDKDAHIIEEPIVNEEKGLTKESPEDVVGVSNSDDIIKKEFIEGELVSFPKLMVDDPDNDEIKINFNSPLDETGKWQTQEGDEGEYLTTITASDGVTNVAQKVLIVINPKNKAPKIGIADKLTFKEGETVFLDPEISDPEKDDVELEFSGWMNSDTKKTDFDDAGERKVVITATDSQGNTAKKEIIVFIENVNRAPVLEVFDVVFNEAELVELKVNTSDPDGDSVEVDFSEPMNNLGVWKTKYGDAGVYDVRVTASDGELEVKKTAKLTVVKVNRPPVIVFDDFVKINEGETLVLDVNIEDPDNDNIKLEFSGWMDSNTKKVGFEDAGEHKVTITATDSEGNAAKKSVAVVVKDVNRPPVFAPGSFS